MLLMFLGYLFRRFGIFPEQTPQVLNLYIIYVSLPAMVLLEVPKITLSTDMLVPILLPWVITLLGAMTIYIASRVCGWSRSTTGALLLVGVLGNTSFLGIPIVSYYFGSEALPYVMIYDQLGTFLLLSTYGSVVIALYSSSSRVSVGATIKKIFTFPPLVALLIALSIQGLSFATPITHTLSTLAGTLVPIALISVGYGLQLKIPREDLSAFIIGLSTKLILLPLYAFGIIYLLDIDGLGVSVSILESAMGPMITAGIVASLAGFSTRLSSSIIGYGVILSFATTAVVVGFLS
jgi:predicted permease